MSVHSRAFRAGAAPALIKTAGDAVTLHKANGERRQCRALVGTERSSEQPTEHGRRKKRERAITLAGGDYSWFGGEDEPLLDAEIQVGDVRYPIVAVDGVGGALVRCQCCRVEKIELSRPNLREAR